MRHTAREQERNLHLQQQRLSTCPTRQASSSLRSSSTQTASARIGGGRMRAIMPFPSFRDIIETISLPFVYRRIHTHRSRKRYNSRFSCGHANTIRIARPMRSMQLGRLYTTRHAAHRTPTLSIHYLSVTDRPLEIGRPDPSKLAKVRRRPLIPASVAARCLDRTTQRTHSSTSQPTNCASPWPPVSADRKTYRVSRRISRRLTRKVSSRNRTACITNKIPAMASPFPLRPEATGPLSKTYRALHGDQEKNAPLC